MKPPRLTAFVDQAARGLAVFAKDIRVYYLTPPMIMFGLLLPFFLFFSFSVKRDMGAEMGAARLLAITTFFTASSAGPVIIPVERQNGTYDRLLTAPLSLTSLLLSKAAVGAFFGLTVSVVPLLVAVLALDVNVASWPLLLAALILSSTCFATFGLVFASIPARSVGAIMMPSTLVRWPLLFVSGIFIPLGEMAAWLLPVALLSPLTYAQDLFDHALLGHAFLPSSLDLVCLTGIAALMLVPAAALHRKARRVGA